MDSGITDIFKTLDALPVEVEKKLFRKGLKEIGDALVAETKPMVPVGTGALRDSIGKKISLDKKKYGGITLSVGTGLFYGRFIEMGFMRPNGEHVPARPFLTPVYESTFGKVMSQMSAFLADEVPKELAKSVKKTSRG